MTSTNTISPAAGRVRRLGRALSYGVVVAVLVTAVAFLVRTKFDPLIRADDAAIRAATDVTRAHPGFRSVLLDWQWLFQPTRVYLVAVPVCLWAWFAKDLRTRSWWAFATMMVGWNLALLAKYAVQRARPVVADPVSHSPGYSFPSGHVANIAIGVSAVVVLLWPLLRRPAARAVAVALGALLVVLTALDRIFLGVHFPSDTVGGVLLGCGLVLASYAGYVGWNPPSPTGHPTADRSTTDQE